MSIVLFLKLFLKFRFDTWYFYFQIETMAQDFGQDPVSVVCPSCKAQITTEVDHVSSTKTHLIALALCLCLYVYFY